jgi:hypothetical protein
VIEATTTILHDVTREALEDTALLVTEAAPSHVAWPHRLTRASIEFRGPLWGKLSLVAGEELLVSVAADMLGVTPDDEEALSHAGAVLAELANEVASSLMAKLFGTAIVYRLGAPQLSPETAEVVSTAAQSGVVRVDMEARPLLVELEMRGQVFS